jgi:hypothetical protein
MAQQLTDLSPARSPLWRERSLRRQLETAKAPLTATREAAKRFGGSVNSAFVAAAAHAAGAYHAALGQPVDELRASMAVSTRTDDAAANAFTLARMLVPTGPMPMVERLRLVHEAAQAARQEATTGWFEIVASVSAPLPAAVIARAVRAHARSVDFATSNIRGTPIPVYVAGAKMTDNYPIGPLVGVAFNLTALSYNGDLDMGLHVDPSAIEHPELLRESLDAAFRELLAA